MGKYLHYFDSETAYTQERSSNYVEPWVSYTEGRGVDYNMGEEEKEMEYLHKPFTIEALESGNITWQSLGSCSAEYSTDGGESWETMTSGTSIPVSNGDEVMLKRNEFSSEYEPVTVLASSGNFNVKGNIMSLTNGGNFESATSITNTFNYLFASCKKLISAEHLKLPAVTVNPSGVGGYMGMFRECSNMVHGPKILPATNLLKDQTYEYMFSGCTSMVSGPTEISATSLPTRACDSMFAGCSSLTKAPEILATCPGSYACNEMFRGCTSLTDAPSRLAENLTNYCYYYMFAGCSGLTSLPVLPATALTNSCYNFMFSNCTSLKEIVELPSNAVFASECCYGMYVNCTSLETINFTPPSLAISCCQIMFSGCTSLNNVTCLLETPYFSQSNNAFGSWLVGVASTGTFTRSANAPTIAETQGQPGYVWQMGGNGIPLNWTVIDATA